MLLREAKLLAAPGRMVDVAGSQVHVYAEGIKNSAKLPVIVLLSGSGEPSPVYNYKVLYSKLTDVHRVVVVEKFGYGYSDVSGLSRDVKTMVEQNREALIKAGEPGPYVLMPHSMSALEALYWAHEYPDEVVSIIGLDMALPESYHSGDRILIITFNKMMTFLGLHRIPFLYHISTRGLNENEIVQQKYIVYRQTLNNDVYAECRLVYKNACTVKKFGIPHIPILMFSSNMSAAWQKVQDDFAAQSENITLITLNCGHYIHYFEADYISEEIKKYIRSLYGKKNCLITVYHKKTEFENDLDRNSMFFILNQPSGSYA